MSCRVTMQLKASILLMALVDISVGAVMVFRADRYVVRRRRSEVPHHASIRLPCVVKIPPLYGSARPSPTRSP